MALTERDFNLKATYYFRMKASVYCPSTIDRVAVCGHEIGYHYETVDKCHGDLDAASELFASELRVLRQHYEVKTACMHGNPLTRFDNKQIWTRHGLSYFGLIGEPYISLDYERFAYFSDSGRTWQDNTWRKTKDIISGRRTRHPRNTDELIEIIEGGDCGDVCLLVHPERWPKNTLGYVHRYLVDMAYLCGKRIVRYRPHRHENTDRAGRPDIRS